MDDYAIKMAVMVQLPLHLYIYMLLKKGKPEKYSHINPRFHGWVSPITNMTTVRMIGG